MEKGRKISLAIIIFLILFALLPIAVVYGFEVDQFAIKLLQSIAGGI